MNRKNVRLHLAGIRDVDYLRQEAVIRRQQSLVLAVHWRANLMPLLGWISTQYIVKVLVKLVRITN